MTTLRFKTKTGAITEMVVGELLEVDGKPFKSGDDYQEVRDAVIHLEGRVQTLETLLTTRSNDGG